MLFQISLLFLLFWVSNAQQKIAIFNPRNDQVGKLIADRIEKKLSEKFSIVDQSLSKAVLSAQEFENPFNLSLTEAKNLGEAAGCNFFLLIKAEVLERTSLEKGTFKEAYTAIFFVSSKSGRLILWKFLNAEDKDEAVALKKLFLSIDEFLTRFVTEIQSLLVYDLDLQDEAKFPEFDEKSGIRPPIPYRRIKPEYPKAASLYLVRATIDVAVDITERGEVARVEVLRWAGFELEEAVIKAIRQMNWRPAEKNGKFLASRVLLRYNFRDIREEKQDVISRTDYL